MSLNHLQMSRPWIESGKPVEGERQNKNCKIEFEPHTIDTENDFTPIEFSTLANTWFLEDVHLSRTVGTFPADYFVFDASVTDFMTVSDEKLPDSFGSESLFSGMPEV